VRALGRSVQLRQATALTSEEYVRQEGWRQARLDRCPVHGTAEKCGFRRLGTYQRVTPVGMRVARYYCPAAQTTFSLLPDCLAAKLSGDLDEVERVVAAVDAAPSVEAAAVRLRPDIEPPGAVRWIRRRLGPTRAVLLALVTLVPALVGSCRPTLGEVGQQLGTPVLRRARSEAEKHLGKLSAPIGFGPRRRRTPRRRAPPEHDLGADLPP
jgi:hypothetical protein